MCEGSYAVSLLVGGPAWQTLPAADYCIAILCCITDSASAASFTILHDFNEQTPHEQASAAPGGGYRGVWRSPDARLKPPQIAYRPCSMVSL